MVDASDVMVGVETLVDMLHANMAYRSKAHIVISDTAKCAWFGGYEQALDDLRREIRLMNGEVV